MLEWCVYGADNEGRARETIIRYFDAQWCLLVFDDSTLWRESLIFDEHRPSQRGVRFPACKFWWQNRSYASLSILVLPVGVQYSTVSYYSYCNI